MIRALSMTLLCALTALVLAGCLGGDDDDNGAGASTGQGQQLARGGELKIAMRDDVFAAFDPAKENSGPGLQLLHCCLTRTLMSFKGRELAPDLASAPPKVSDDGLTWTFKLRPGIHYGPPLQDQEVVAQDFIRAITRVANPSASVGGNPGNFSIIQGFDDVTKKKARTITGLSAPDKNTLVVKLTQKAGDLPFHFSQQSSAPLPPGVARGHVRDYGRFLVSSGPYMFEGSENLDFSKPPKEQKPVAGYVPGRSVTFVRNPSWKESTDPIRGAYPDRISVAIGGTPDDLYNKIEAGELDATLGETAPPPRFVQRYATDPNLKDRLHVDQGTNLNFISLNIAQPPFDDIAVRKAFNLAIDKSGIRQQAGGKLSGDLADHIIPDIVLGNAKATGAYATKDSRGDIGAAKKEMSKSKYDSDKNGSCDADACKVKVISQEGPPYADQLALVQDAASKLGLSFDVRTLSESAFYEQCVNAEAKLGACIGAQWGDPNVTGWGSPLFASGSIGPEACCNLSLVGAPDDALKKLGYEPLGLENVDGAIKDCDVQSGSDQQSCYAKLDDKLMTDIAPFVPLYFGNVVAITSERLKGYNYDLASGTLGIHGVSVAG